MDTRYVQVAEVEVAPMLEETILYHPGNQRFCVLNPTAAFVWEKLKSPSSESEVAAAVLGVFADVAAEQAHRDVADVLKELHNLGLIATL